MRGWGWRRNKAHLKNGILIKRRNRPLSADRDGFFVIGCIFAASSDFVFGSVFLYNTQKIPSLFMQLYKKLKNKKNVLHFYNISIIF